MKLIFIVCSALMVSSALQNNAFGLENDGEKPAVKVVTNADPVISVLNHFRHLPDLWLPKQCKGREVILVSDKYAKSKGFISAAQLSSDLRGEKWSVPEDARVDMVRRTDAHERFDASNLPDYLKSMDFTKEPRVTIGEFAKHYPAARCKVTLWPPGYTVDKKQVIVRFNFNPTPHGASALYLLVLRDGKWHVLNFKIGYYV